jgi:predicted RNA binding protein YcfA (HicA-like mRNA interferase family)
VIELCDEELALVTGRAGKKSTDKTIKTKDLVNELKGAGFSARNVKTGSHVIWTHEAIPGYNVTLQQKSYTGIDVASHIRKTIQEVKEKTAGQSSSQGVPDVIDIDQI